MLWSGDELGQPNDPDWASEPGHEDDNRWAHRPRLDWTRAEHRHDPATVAGRVFGDVVALVRARASVPHLHGAVETRIGPVDDAGVLVTVREHPLGRFVGVYNVTPEPRPWHGRRLHELGVADSRDSSPATRSLGRPRHRVAAALRRPLAHHRPPLIANVGEHRRLAEGFHPRSRTCGGRERRFRASRDPRGMPEQPALTRRARRRAALEVAAEFDGVLTLRRLGRSGTTMRRSPARWTTTGGRASGRTPLPCTRQP